MTKDQIISAQRLINKRYELREYPINKALPLYGINHVPLDWISCLNPWNSKLKIDIDHLPENERSLL
jgi:hypothetical protein